MSAERWTERLLDLGLNVRRHVTEFMTQGVAGTDPVAHQGGDAIYPIDRHVEPMIERTVESWPDECRPLLLIAEGIGDDGRKRFDGGSGPGFRLLLDPIDGTRPLMYGKRSAWFLAAVSPDRGAATTLADSFASVMVELPPPKQEWGDAFSAITGGPALGFRSRIDQSERHPLRFGPSTATTLRHGFGQVVNFFPGTKLLAAELSERVATAILGEPPPGEALLFDDQYLSTGGQMVELMLGRDRFCCDLRPLFHCLQGRTGGLECHPYDVAGLLTARQAGVILTDGFGRPLDAPLSVHDGVHWCGYANARIRAAVEPIVQGWLAERGLTPPGS